MSERKRIFDNRAAPEHMMIYRKRNLTNKDFFNQNPKAILRYEIRLQHK